MAEEIHQEFLLRLCEIGEDKIKEVIDGNYIDWYCLDIINKIWGKRFRVKGYEKGSTNPFFEFSNMSVDADLSYFTPDYNTDYDYNYVKVKDILNKDINSDDKDTNYKARVFTYSIGLSIKDGEVKDKDYIKVLNLPENVGMIKMMNLLTYNASSELVFHVQDDNVFPFHWDIVLLKDYTIDSILTPNQIEPFPSMFKQFEIEDFGRDPKTFDLNYFWQKEEHFHKSKIDKSGSTFPFLISKQNYLTIGGFDESYPGPWVVDWEFFMKCKISGLDIKRTYNCHFYHFVSLGHATPSPEKVAAKQQKEMECHEYAKYKWGEYIKHNPEDNSKYL